MVATGEAHHHLSAALVLTLACSLPGASFIHQQCGFASPAAPRAAASLSRKSRFCNREVPPRRLRRRHATTTGAAAEAAVAKAAAEERPAHSGVESECAHIEALVMTQQQQQQHIDGMP